MDLMSPQHRTTTTQVWQSQYNRNSKLYVSIASATYPNSVKYSEEIYNIACCASGTIMNFESDYKTKIINFRFILKQPQSQPSPNHILLWPQ